MNNFGRDPYISAYNDYKLRKLHEAWLDPDTAYER